MTGPEHYRAAERLASQANHWTYGDGNDPAVGAALAAEAQVHATLALAADLTAPMPDALLELIATIKDLCGGSTCPKCQRAYAHVDGLLAARFEDAS